MQERANGSRAKLERDALRPPPVRLDGCGQSPAHLLWFALVAYAFSSDAARRIVARSRHLVERGIGAALVALGLGLAVSSLKQG